MISLNSKGGTAKKCCHEHDCCYRHLKSDNCDISFDHYDYTFFQGKVQCSTKGSWCEQQLCACDKTLAFCLQRNLNTYKNHLRRLSRCEGVAPAKADILDLNEMVRQVTGKIPIFFYSSYGCYCRIGGQGLPRDATDWCCYDHNCCYGYLTPHNCDYLYDHYDYTFFQGNVQCYYQKSAVHPLPRTLHYSQEAMDVQSKVILQVHTSLFTANQTKGSPTPPPKKKTSLASADLSPAFFFS
ncbi:hypothetical protein E5288_WYG016929 [Bos mutus]|uniref:Phospholipase A2 n=1 Tax=Bos mutus TaxID=72004 RepID=A0A6B0RX60_9CETA|nr:hypothetical protein [Bos mutus]